MLFKIRNKSTLKEKYIEADSQDQAIVNMTERYELIGQASLSDIKLDKIKRIRQKAILFLEESDAAWIAAASRGESGSTRKTEVETFKSALRSLIASVKSAIENYSTVDEIDSHSTVWPNLADPTEV